MVFMYAFYQWYFPDVHGLRYIVYPALILTVMVGGAVGWTGGLIEQWCGTLVSRGAMTLLVVGIVTLTAVNYKRMVDGLCWTKWDWLLGVPASGLSEAWCEERWVEEHVPPGGVLAAKDIGRLTYFTHSRIVDLAGIIKPDVIESIRERDLASYIVDQGATHVITVRDPTYYLNQALDLSDRRFEGIEDFCPHSHYVLYGVRQNR